MKKDILISSLNFTPNQGELFRNFANPIYHVGNLNYETGTYQCSNKNLLDYVKKEIRELFDIVVIRGQWDASLSAPMSNAYQELLKTSTEITNFDISLAEDGPLGSKIKNLLHIGLLHYRLPCREWMSLGRCPYPYRILQNRH